MFTIISRNYITLSRAAKISGYAPDYISFLIRSRKIKGKKIPGKMSWVIPKNEIIKYGLKNKNIAERYSSFLLDEKYLTLKEAAAFSGYSSDHLGHLIRGGKIRGEKLFSGISWVTTAESLESYRRSAHHIKLVIENKKTKDQKINLSDSLSDAKKAIKFFNFFSLRIPKRGVAVAVLFLIIFSGLVARAFTSKNQIQIAEIYSTQTIGGWQNPQNVQGPPSVLPTGNIDSFSETNSAVYKNGAVDLIVLNFQQTETKEIKEQSEEDSTSTDQEVEQATEIISEEQTTSTTEIITEPSEKKEKDLKKKDVVIDATTTEATTTEAVQLEQTIGSEEATSVEMVIPEIETTSNQIEATTSETVEQMSFLEKIGNFLGGGIVKAKQTPSFEELTKKEFKSAKIKFSFAIFEKQQEDVLTIDPQTTNNDQATNTGAEINNDSAPEKINFFGKIKNFFALLTNKINEITDALVSKMVLIAKAEEATSTLTDIEPFTIEQATTEASVIIPEENIIDTEATSTESINIEKETSTDATTTELAEDSSVATTTINEGTTTAATETEETEESLSSVDAKIRILWSLDGENWQILYVISSYPLSNALNNLSESDQLGDYFSFAAPFLKSWDDVKNLKIKFEGIVGGETKFTAFLDSVWVEAEYQEEEKGEFELRPVKKDWRADETPEFDVIPKGEDLEKNIVEKLFERASSIFQEEPKVEAYLINPDKKEKLLDRGTDFSHETHSPTKIKIFRQQGFVPGLHKLEINYEKDGKTYYLEQEFTWGVLAINTNKSIYLPGETAYLQMAALKDDGHTICDANLNLEIILPNGTSTFPEIKTSGACGQDNITDKPDYIAYYQAIDKGTYQMKLTNLDTGHEISDSFEVRDSVPFNVERTGPTRIYPPAEYEIKIKIILNQDFKGEIRETVPESFAIKTESEQYQIQNATGGEKIISWIVDWKKGEERELKYQFDAPDISPNIYLLGPLTFENTNENLLERLKKIFSPTDNNTVFAEARHWQIAADQTEGILLFWDPQYGSVPIGWTCVSCLTSDDFYQDFPMGSSTAGQTGGVSTSTHTVSVAVGTVPAGALARGTTNSSPYNHLSHTHTQSTLVYATSTLPKYYDLQIIKRTSGTGLPKNIIAMFDATPPSGWTSYTSADGYFLRGQNTTSTGGSVNHQHNLTTNLAASSASTRRGTTANAVSTETHTHTYSTSTTAAYNIPPFLTVILATNNATTTVDPENLIAMFDASLPSSGWQSLSGNGQVFASRFIIASSTANTSSGTSTHTHANFNASSSVNATASNGGTTGSTIIGAHAHNLSYSSFSAQDSQPPYRTVIIAKRLPNALSGKVYSNEGTSALLTGPIVKLAINGGSIATTTASGTDGSYSFSVGERSAGTVFTLFLDATGTKAVAVYRYSGSGDATSVDLYQNRIIVRHNDAGPITLSDLDQYDSINDSDVLFEASSTAGTLTASSTSELYVWPSTTYSNYSTSAAATTSFADLDIIGTFNASSTQSISVSGQWLATSTAVFNSASSTVTFTSTLATTTIRTNGYPFYNLTFNGSGGIWTFLDAATTTNDLTVTAGTASSSYNMYVHGGDVAGNGTLNWTGGSFVLDGTGYFGGTSAWTFSNLNFGNSSPATTTATSTATTTISGILTIASGSSLNAGQRPWVLSGSGTPFVKTGTFTAATSTFQYAAGANTYITDTDYYNLELKPGAGATSSYNIPPAAQANHKWSWGENIGWQNWSSTYGTVTGGAAGLTGYVWAENVGWIKLDYDGVAGATNLSSTTWGVTNDGSGNLGGYAWGENVGWINFHPTHSQVTIDGSGHFSGYAWGENVGWINFGHTQTDYIVWTDLGLSGPTYTLATTTGKTINVNNNLTIGNGINPVSVTAATNNPSLDINGTTTISASSAFIAPSTASFTVAGNWANTGTFTHSSGTTTFDGSSTTTFSGATTFFNFNSITPSKALVFATGTSATTTVAGTLTLNGQATTTKIRILSNQSGSYSYLNALGNASVYWADVKDNNAIGSVSGIPAASSTDSGNNINWLFSSLTISGKVYTDEGLATTTATTVIALTVNGTKVATTSISNGSYSFSRAISSFSIIIIYWDTDGGSKAVTITKGATSSISDFDLYQNRIIVRHEGTSALTITDLDKYDFIQDTDILYTATTSPSVALTIDADSELYIWPNKTFAPGGNVTLNPGGSGDAWDGSLKISSGSIFQATGTESHSIGGSWYASSTSSFNTASTTIAFTSTAGGKTITTNGKSFYNLTFNGSGGVWTFLDAATTTNDLTVTAGTASSSYNMSVYGGDISGNGTLNWTGGTFLLDGTGYYGGTSAWTFNNLTFGDGSGATTITATSTATTTISGTLTVASSQILNAGSRPWVLSGSGTPFVKTGTLTQATSTFYYTSTGNTTSTAATYYNLSLAPSGAGSPTYNLGSGAFVTDKNLTIGNGTNVVTVTAANNNPSLDINGTTTISASSTFIAPSTASFTIAGNWSNQGSFTHSSGTTTFDGSSTSTFFGATTFFNFNSITPSKALVFATGTSATTTVAGMLTLNGQATTTKIKLITTHPGQYCYLNALASTSVTYVNVKDNNATGSVSEILAASSTDSGNNVNWSFGAIDDLQFTLSPGNVSLDLRQNNDFTDSYPIVLTATTSHPSGFIIKAHMANTLGKLTTSTAEIIRYPYDNSSPKPWTETCNASSTCCGFGYTTNDSSLTGGTIDRFTNPTSYAGFATSSAAADPVATGEKGGESYTVTVKGSVASDQKAESYTGTIYFIATINY